MSKKAVAYIRVSSESQEDNTSLENQRRMIIAYALNNGFEIADWYQDTDSGSNESREGLTSLRKRFAQKDCQAVIVFKVDRFSRSVLLGSTVRKEIEDNGGILISVSEAFDVSTPMGRMMLNILQTFAEFEKDTINTRFKMGKERRVKTKGGWLGGTPPIGYKAIGSRISPAKGALEIDENAAEAVKLCFELKNQNLPYSQIAKELNKAGYKTSKGKEFQKATVFRILSRKDVYNGNKAINYSFELENCSGEQPRIL